MKDFLNITAIILVIIAFLYKFYLFKTKKRRQKTRILKLVKLKEIEKEGKEYKITAIHTNTNDWTETEYQLYHKSKVPNEFVIEISYDNDDGEVISVYKKYKTHELLIPFILFGISLILFYLQGGLKWILQ